MASCKYTERIQKEKRFFILFALLSVILPAVVLILPIRPQEESLDTWFQRSGSLMVVLALLAEMRAYQMFDVFKPSGLVDTTYKSAKAKYFPQVKLFNLCAFILITAGTVIWGYGDLFI